MLKEEVLRELEDQDCRFHSVSNNKYLFIVHNEEVRYYFIEHHESFKVTCRLNSKSPKVIKRAKELAVKLKEMIIHKSSKRLLFLCKSVELNSMVDNSMIETTSSKAILSYFIAALLSVLASSHFFVPLFKNHSVYAFAGFWIFIWILWILFIEDIEKNITSNILSSGLISLIFSGYLFIALWFAHYISLFFYIPITMTALIYGGYHSCLYRKLHKLID